LVYGGPQTFEVMPLVIIDLIKHIVTHLGGPATVYRGFNPRQAVITAFCLSPMCVLLVDVSS